MSETKVSVSCLALIFWVFLAIVAWSLAPDVADWIGSGL